jgi:hypothetical protein
MGENHGAALARLPMSVRKPGDRRLYFAMLVALDL